MRYAVLADIHGNLQALDAVLAETRRQGVDGYLVAGDLVGYGADPNACVERVAALDAVCVAGNHDLIALGRLSADRCIPLAQASLRWTAAVLSDAVASLPRGAPAACQRTGRDRGGAWIPERSAGIRPQPAASPRPAAAAARGSRRRASAGARAHAHPAGLPPPRAGSGRSARSTCATRGRCCSIQVRSASRASCGYGRASCCSTPNAVAPASWRSRTTSTAAGTRWSARDSRSDPATCVRRRCAPACARCAGSSSRDDGRLRPARSATSDSGRRPCSPAPCGRCRPCA